MAEYKMTMMSDGGQCSDRKVRINPEEHIKSDPFHMERIAS